VTVDVDVIQCGSRPCPRCGAPATKQWSVKVWGLENGFLALAECEACEHLYLRIYTAGKHLKRLIRDMVREARGLSVERPKAKVIGFPGGGGRASSGADR